MANIFPAWPAFSGGQRRVFHVGEQLSREFDVDLLALDRNGPFKVERFSPSFREIRVPADQAYLDALKTIKRRHRMAHELAYSLHWRLCATYQSILTELSAKAAVLISEHPYSIHALLAARGRAATPIIYDSHNVELHLKQVTLKGFPEDIETIRATEAAAVAEAAFVCACSGPDGPSLAAEYGADPAKVDVIETGVDTGGFRFLAPPERETAKSALGFGGRFVSVFAGSHHLPNFAAADVVLGLARRFPDDIFLFVGSICKYPGIRGAPLRNVARYPGVSEAAKWLAFQTADAGLNPMAAGSGINVKMLEYGAAGLAILSTPFGARGTPFARDTHYFEAGFDDFERAYAGLRARGRAELGAVGARARATAVSKSDWSVAGAAYRSKLRQILGIGPPRAEARRGRSRNGG